VASSALFQLLLSFLRRACATQPHQATRTPDHQAQYVRVAQHGVRSTQQTANGKRPQPLNRVLLITITCAALRTRSCSAGLARSLARLGGWVAFEGRRSALGFPLHSSSLRFALV